MAILNAEIPIVVPFIRRHRLTFQHDNAQPHVARIGTQFPEAENVHVLPWPAYSDVSPFEHVVWDSLDRRVPVPANIQQLRATIEEEWDNIPQTTVEIFTIAVIICAGSRTALITCTMYF
jgi:hypothetical protein